MLANPTTWKPEARVTSERNHKFTSMCSILGAKGRITRPRNAVSHCRGVRMHRHCPRQTRLTYNTIYPNPQRPPPSRAALPPYCGAPSTYIPADRPQREAGGCQIDPADIANHTEDKGGIKISHRTMACAFAAM